MQIFEMEAVTDPRCPACNSGMIVEVDIVYVYASVNGIRNDGSIEWSGESEVNWNSQQPAHDPPRYECKVCRARLKLVGTEFEEENS